MMARKTALIMAGGTGGHIFPGLAIADALRARQWHVEWLGTLAGMENTLVPKAGIRMHTLKFEGVVGRGWLAKVKLPFALLRAMWSARRTLKTLRPNVVVGMGGYPALPGGLVASLAGIPLVTHEQNAVPGQTNRALASRANRVLCAFPGTYKALNVKAQVVGNPVRRDIVDIGLSRPIWDGKRPLKIAVVGGSRGAQALNEIVPQCLSRLPLAQRPSVIHQCGKGHLASMRMLYRDREVEADVREFIDDMSALYREVDLFICRSGASTVSELACAEMPSILVPYPYHADQQQLHNARVLSSAGGAIVFEQPQLSPEVLAHQIENLTPQQLSTMRSILRTIAHPEAAETIADVIESIGASHEI